MKQSVYKQIKNKKNFNSDVQGLPLTFSVAGQQNQLTFHSVVSQLFHLSIIHIKQGCL